MQKLMTMDIEAQIRKIKIDIINDTHNPIIDLFNEIWSKLSITETNVYHNNGGEFIYFIDDGHNHNQWIFFQDNKSERFWCIYEYYWSIFQFKLKLNYTEVQALTKILVENALNNVVRTPKLSFALELQAVENALNNVVRTPQCNLSTTGHPMVDNAINNGMTISPDEVWYAPLVDNALNNVVATPTSIISYTTDWVENALTKLNNK